MAVPDFWKFCFDFLLYFKFQAERTSETKDLFIHSLDVIFFSFTSVYAYCWESHEDQSNFYNLPVTVLGGIISSIWNFCDFSSPITHVVQLWPIFDRARNHENFCLYQNARIESLASRFLEFDWSNLQLPVVNFLGL